MQRSSRRRARIHERVIALDTHNDIDPRNFTGDATTPSGSTHR